MYAESTTNAVNSTLGLPFVIFYHFYYYHHYYNIYYSVFLSMFSVAPVERSFAECNNIT